MTLFIFTEDDRCPPRPSSNFGGAALLIEELVDRHVRPHGRRKTIDKPLRRNLPGGPHVFAGASKKLAAYPRQNAHGGMVP